MARSDQYIGLNDRARRLVLSKQKVREVGTTIFANGKKKSFNRWRRVPAARKEHAGVLRGVWTPVVAVLHRYTMPDGRVLTEYVQESPWCGGPCYFIALMDAHGKPVPESLWTSEEITSA